MKTYIKFIGTVFLLIVLGIVSSFCFDGMNEPDTLLAAPSFLAFLLALGIFGRVGYLLWRPKKSA